jgi:hypothetical protein
MATEDGAKVDGATVGWGIYEKTRKTQGIAG